jgi:predicted HAD superfamily Cof-like phosphohydrolase
MTTYTLDVYEKDGEHYIDLPPELAWDEGTELEWIDRGDGSWLLRKKETMDFVESVLEFNRVAGSKDGEFNKRKLGLYYGLVMEELAEGIAAFGEQREAFVTMQKFLNAWSLRFKEGDFDHNMDHLDRVEALDAFVDLAVVSLGGAMAVGADVQGACMEVANSNLSKFPVIDGVRTALKDANGKVMKAETYKAPELQQYVSNT